MELTKYTVRYFKTREHYDNDLSDKVNDVFYDEDACIAKCQDLLYRYLHFAAQYSLEHTPNTIIGEMTFDDFDRAEFKKQIQTNINNRFKNGRNPRS